MVKLLAKPEEANNSQNLFRTILLNNNDTTNTVSLTFACRNVELNIPKNKPYLRRLPSTNTPVTTLVVASRCFERLLSANFDPYPPLFLSFVVHKP
jgi:hypothetical protein